MTSSKRLLSLGVVVAFALSAAVAYLLPSAAHAADENPRLSVRLTALSPTVLEKGSDIVVRGTVTNRNEFAWRNVQAYLVIPSAPFTSRAQVEIAKTNSNSYTGRRVVEIDSFAQVGDLAAGQTREFDINVPYEQLDINGAEGVYPLGVQMLATPPDGIRSNEAVGRATTFIPLLRDPPKDVIPTSVAWPFLMPTYRASSGNYARTPELLTAVSPGGRLHNLLQLARSTPPDSGTVLIDPALLVAVDAMARGKRLGADVTFTDDQKAAARSFVDDLVDLARRDRCWIMDYARPDLLALATYEEFAEPLRSAIETATRNALEDFGISCRPASWPQPGSATPEVVAEARGAGDEPVILAETNVRGWDRRNGSLVTTGTEAGPVPLLIDDSISDAVPGERSVVSLRQRIVSESALAVLQRKIDSESKADTVAVVDPMWDPGADWAEAQLGSAFGVTWVDAASLDTLLLRPIGSLTGTVNRAPSAEPPIDRELLAAAAKLHRLAALLTSVLADQTKLAVDSAQDVAQGVSARWRADGNFGRKAVRGAAARIDAQLDKITIEGPPRVTLSSDSGGFPLTISNGTKEAIRVGVRVDSSNPGLNVPNVEPVEVAADERRTVTVNVDLGNQRSATITATLMAPSSQTFGSPAVFNVRTSTIGVVLWIGFGVAGLLIVAAIVRRFWLAGRSATRDV